MYQPHRNREPQHSYTKYRQSSCDIEGLRHPINKNIIQTYGPSSQIADAMQVTSDDYIVLDSNYRDRDQDQDAADFEIPWASMSSKPGTSGLKQYYLKLVSAAIPYNVNWVNEMYLGLRVSCSSAGTARKFSTNNPNLTNITFVVPVNKHRFLVPGGVNTSPTFIHLDSPMIIKMPFKVDDGVIRVTWLYSTFPTVAVVNPNTPLTFGNPAPPAGDNRSLQCFVMIKASENYEQLLRAGE